MTDGAVGPSPPPDGLFRLSGFEVVTGWVLGFDEFDAGVVSSSPRTAFEQAVRTALRRPPCVVAFSGGRDSSAILAVAKAVAEREGLDPPIAATHVFIDDAGSDESAWQELVIGHLGIDDWQRVPADDSVDILGGPARRGLRRYGLLWPALGHCHASIRQLARGGSLLTGMGGDEVMGAQRVTPLVRAVRQRPSRSTTRRAAAAVAPTALRQLIAARRHRRRYPRPWLRPPVYDELVRRLAIDDASFPLRWDSAVRRMARQRATVLSVHNMAAVARHDDVECHEPFLDRGFVDSLAAQGGRFGYPGRSETMDMLFSDVLPSSLIHRPTKAYFNAVAVGASSRAFAERWSGRGVDTELVDPEALREAWLGPMPQLGTMCLLQAAWLADDTA